MLISVERPDQLRIAEELCPQIFGTRSFKIPSLFSTTPRATFQCVHHSRLGSFICTRNTFCCRPSYILPYKATQLCFFECSGRRLYRCFVFLPLANLKAADSANHPHRWNSSAANQFRFVPAKLFIFICILRLRPLTIFTKNLPRETHTRLTRVLLGLGGEEEQRREEEE